MTTRVPIRNLPTGITGLDEVLGGGIPEFSFNLITGGPGCGKTTLGHHIAFANASDDCKVLYFTVVGEPPIKMLRYQQQFTFFDVTQVGDSLRFVSLGVGGVHGRPRSGAASASSRKSKRRTRRSSSSIPSAR